MELGEQRAIIQRGSDYALAESGMASATMRTVLLLFGRGKKGRKKGNERDRQVSLASPKNFFRRGRVQNLAIGSIALLAPFSSLPKGAALRIVAEAIRHSRRAR